jgi:hypothetical protein
MKAMYGGALLSFVVFVCFHSPSQAGPITDEEKRLCKDDYHKFCGSYGLGTKALRDCMNRVGHSLSHNCVDALIDAGEVSRGEVERRKKSGK